MAHLTIVHEVVARLLLLGGSYIATQSYCTTLFDEHERDSVAEPFGFRCCSG